MSMLVKLCTYPTYVSIFLTAELQVLVFKDKSKFKINLCNRSFVIKINLFQNFNIETCLQDLLLTHPMSPLIDAFAAYRCTPRKILKNFILYCISLGEVFISPHFNYNLEWNKYVK